MNWTKDLPELDGFYWAVDVDGDIRGFDIKQGLVEFYECTVRVKELAHEWRLTHWMGPIEPPEPPKEVGR